MPLELEPEPIVDPVTNEYLGDRYLRTPKPSDVDEDFRQSDQYRQSQAQRAASMDGGRSTRSPVQYQMPQGIDPNSFNIDAWQNMWADAQKARGTGDVLQDSQFAGQNQLWADELRSRALGQSGPSAAEMQLQSGMDTQSAQALSLAKSARGMSPGMAMRQAQQAQGQMAAQTNQQAGIMRAQETQAAGQAYQQALQAGMSQEQAANQARLAQQQIQDAWLGVGLQGGQAEARYNQLTQLQIEAMNRGDTQEAARLSLEAERMKNQLDLAGQRRSDSMWGGIFSTAGQVATAAILKE